MAELEEKLRAASSIYPIKKLIRFGGSFALIVPKEWVEYCCDEVEGSYWIKVNYEGANLTAKLLSKEDIIELAASLEKKDD